MIWLTVYFACWFVLLGLSVLSLAWRRGSPPQPLPDALPRVSILIAARNEEAALGRCLHAIRQLRYPVHLVEVLVGDDGSTDRTRAVAEAAMQGYAGSFRCLAITEALGQARGKANVLAHLTRAATTDYFFITDADIAVPPTWLTGLLAHAALGVGTITGLTLVQGPRLFHQLQGLDWLTSLGLVQVVSDWGVAVTAMGNNMLVTRAAYQATGGYETLPFSVTEDYALFKATVQQGFGHRILFRPEVLAESLPQPTLPALLHQRRRWLRGVEQLPWWLQANLLLYSGFYPALAILCWLAGPASALSVWAAKLLMQAALTLVCYRRAGRQAPLLLLPAFELYTLLLAVGLLGFRLLPLPFVWKGRRYTR
ncbi:glycosyltransferase [Hymenobacter aerilatus]|uniref:Glycosyltransferase n=1 Tax=Hymenobacter aerilatus TaxID=2932251 RepID=A0A8T9T108_9BACT|nr:glycosyltransferase [Hymenobacter aerilatus]UOR06210.1 glycosyltransferase [Hymenobacter aerilatus]